MEAVVVDETSGEAAVSRVRAEGARVRSSNIYVQLRLAENVIDSAIAAFALRRLSEGGDAGWSLCFYALAELRGACASCRAAPNPSYHDSLLTHSCTPSIPAYLDQRFHLLCRLHVLSPSLERLSHLRNFLRLHCVRQEGEGGHAAPLQQSAPAL